MAKFLAPVFTIGGTLWPGLWSDASTELIVCDPPSPPLAVTVHRKAMSARPADVHGEDEGRWAALMAGAQAGDELDYRQLLSELAPAIEGYLRSRFGYHDFVEDCVQEVLIAVHEARHTYQSKRLFRPWLFAIVRHKAIDALRQQQRRDKLAQSEWRERVSTDPSAMPANPEQAVASGRMIAALETPYRDAITLTKIIGLSSAEAAAELDISVSALKVRVHRGIGRLKKMLESDQL